MLHFPSAQGLIVAFAMLLPTLAVAAPSGEIHANASPHLRQFGVGRYDGETRDGKQYLVLHDHEGSVLAEVERRTEGPKHIVQVEQPGDAYTLVWNQRTGVLRLLTTRGQFVLRLGETPSEEARAAYDERALPIRAIVAALDEASRPPTAEDLQSVFAKSEARPPYCNGTNYTGYGVSTYATTGLLTALVTDWLGFSPGAGPVEWVPAFTGSALCEAARSQANSGCFNSDCTGCCAYQDCATLCLDTWSDNGFFCAAASVMGHSCSTAPPSNDGGGILPEGPLDQSMDPWLGGGFPTGNCCSWYNLNDCSATSDGCTVHWVCTLYGC